MDAGPFLGHHPVTIIFALFPHLRGDGVAQPRQLCGELLDLYFQAFGFPNQRIEFSRHLLSPRVLSVSLLFHVHGISPARHKTEAHTGRGMSPCSMSTRVSSRARVMLAAALAHSSSRVAVMPATPWAIAVHPTAAASRGRTSHQSG